MVAVVREVGAAVDAGAAVDGGGAVDASAVGDDVMPAVRDPEEGVAVSGVDRPGAPSYPAVPGAAPAETVGRATGLPT